MNSDRELLNLPFFRCYSANQRRRVMVSVIVPVYKVEKHLNKCIESILNQTYTDIEVILVQKFLNKWTIFLFCSILFSSNQKEH